MRLPPVIVSEERVIRIDVGLRPFRPSGFRVEREALAAVKRWRFQPVADVFEECVYEALTVLSREQMTAYLEATRVLGKLGRGPEPMLAFLEEWPSVVSAVICVNQCGWKKPPRQRISLLSKLKSKQR